MLTKTKGVYVRLTLPQVARLQQECDIEHRKLGNLLAKIIKDYVDAKPATKKHLNGHASDHKAVAAT